MDTQDTDDALDTFDPTRTLAMPSWSDVRRSINMALEYRARSAIFWLDTTKEPGERDSAKALADNTEKALRQMTRTLYDLASGMSEGLKQTETQRQEIERLTAVKSDLCGVIADKSQEIDRLKRAILLQHAEREAQGRLLRALITHLTNDQVAQVFGDQVGYMADLLYERQARKPQGEEGQ